MGKTAVVLAGLFAVALGSVTIAEFRRSVDSLRGDLGRADGDLRRTRAELARLRDDNRDYLRQMETGAARTLADVEELRSRVAERDIEGLYRDVLAPSVQVTGRGGVGGGTLLFSRKEHTYAVSAYHVLHRAAAKADEPSAIEVKVYNVRGEPVETVEADLLAHDERKDLALLRLRTSRAYDHVARLASRESLRATKVFTPVYAVGCPLGHDPLPTVGEVATLHKEVNGERFWMMNAPTIFGNSGGGIFHRETRELVGVSVMVCTYDGVVSTPVPHLGILVSLDTVYDWLESLCYQFIFDPEATIEDCERARAARGPQASGTDGR
jgi:S1-C subfamily serine protease